jgi:hypothetical protein
VTIAKHGRITSRSASDDRPRGQRAMATNNPLRFPGHNPQSAKARRRRDLIVQNVMRFGGWGKITEGQLADAIRAAELRQIAEEMRLIALTKGCEAVDLDELGRMESRVDRAECRLPPLPSSPPLAAPWHGLLSLVPPPEPSPAAAESNSPGDAADARAARRAYQRDLTRKRRAAAKARAAAAAAGPAGASP